MTSDDEFKALGRSMAQLHMKVGAIQEGLERLGPVATAGSERGRQEAGAGDELQLIFDLLDGVDRALDSHGAASSPQPSVGLWRRLTSSRRSIQAAGADQGLWRGLAMVSAAAHDGLERLGVRPVPCEGPPDGHLHRVVDSEGTGGDPAISRVLRRGWLRGSLVLRTAHVVVQHGGHSQSD